MASSGSGLLPGIWVQGFAPPRAFGRAAASPQTRQMRCWPSSERTTNPSSRRKRQDSLSLSLVLFPPKPLRWVSAGALLGAVIKTPVLYFLHFCVGYHLPSGCCGCVGTTPRGVYFGRKTAFSEWVLCADGHAVPSCTQRFFGVPAWGWYHYPRRVLHAVETLGAQGTRWLNKLLVVYSLPVGSASAHSGSQGQTRGVFAA